MTLLQPAYVMLKPPEPVALDMDRCRSQYGIDGRYDPARFHMTLLPLWDARHLSPTVLTLLDRAMTLVAGEPFRVTLDRLNRNALIGSKGLQGLRALQRALVRCLKALGLPIGDYDFWPHVSLAYGSAPDRRIDIAPIAWDAGEVLLVKSFYGEGRHETLRSWPLTVRQLALFD